MRRFLLLSLTFLAAASAASGEAPDRTEDAMRQPLTLLDFGETDRVEWYVVNDGVMGGVSRSAIRRTDEGTGVFSGELSLENNGGFASVRALIGPTDLSPWHGLELRVRGDGRTYQVRLRTDDRFDGVAYRAFFATREGEWLTVTVPFADFQPTFRGRTVAEAPPLDPARVHQIVFMIADKNPGAFALEIDLVRSWKDQP